MQTAALNVARLWSNVAIPVLAIYGSADFVTAEADHRRMVEIVNAAHPGKATLKVISGMDHYFAPAASPKASLDRVQRGAAAPYDADLTKTVLAWLCERERCTASQSRKTDIPFSYGNS